MSDEPPIPTPEPTADHSRGASAEPASAAREAPMAEVEIALRRYFETTAPSGVTSAYLFGSHAAGRSHRESDVDVAVLFDYGQVPDRAARAGEAVRLNAEVVGATHVNDVDLVVLNDAPPELAARVVTSGRLVYCSNPEVDWAFRRTALLRYGDIQPFLERTRRGERQEGQP